MNKNSTTKVLLRIRLTLKTSWIVPLSTIFSLWLIGFKNTNPSRYGWLWFGDLRAAQVQWEFFRQTALLQIPIAGTPNYGGIEPHSVLFLLPFKLLNPILPANFQFFGILFVVLFTLQAIAAIKLLGYFGLGDFHKNLATSVFVLSPILIFRTAYLSHVYLGGHFLILLSMYLYFKKSEKVTHWLAVCLSMSLLDPYLLLVVVSILVAHLASMIFGAQRHPLKALRLASIVLIIVLGSLAIQGYFVDLPSLRASHTFRLNVAAFVNPHFGSGLNFSFILPKISRIFDQANTSEEIEGFGYLGFGVLVGLLLSSFVYIRRLERSMLGEFLPLLGVSLIWFYVAMSSRGVIFRREFQVPSIDLVEELRMTFRSAPRFVVLLYYLLTLLAVVGVGKISMRNIRFAVLLPIIILLQIVDISPGIWHAHVQVASEKPQLEELRGDEWAPISMTYRHLYVYPTYNFNSDFNSNLADYWVQEDRWYQLVMFAARSKMTSNFAYLAREDIDSTRSENSRVYGELRSGDLSACSIYVVPGRKVWEDMKEAGDMSERALYLDGYYMFVAPKTSCLQSGDL